MISMTVDFLRILKVTIQPVVLLIERAGLFLRKAEKLYENH